MSVKRWIHSVQYNLESPEEPRDYIIFCTFKLARCSQLGWWKSRVHTLEASQHRRSRYFHTAITLSCFHRNECKSTSIAMCRFNITSLPPPRVLHGSYFANLNPPVPAILKTTSDPFSSSSTSYIPHPSWPAINWYWCWTRTQRKIRHIR